MSSLCPPPARLGMGPNGTEWNRRNDEASNYKAVKSKGASCLSFFFASNRVRVQCETCCEHRVCTPKDSVGHLHCPRILCARSKYVCHLSIDRTRPEASHQIADARPSS